MEIIMAIVVLVVVVWYFGSALGAAGDTINNILTESADMAGTQMKVYGAAHKASAINAMAKIDIDTDKVTKAKANIEALRSIEL